MGCVNFCCVCLFYLSHAYGLEFGFRFFLMVPLMSLDCRLLRIVSGFQHVVKLHVVSLRLVFQIFLLISFCISIIVMRNLSCCFLDECACGGCLGVAEAQLLFVQRKSSVSSSCPSSLVSASFGSSAFVVLFVFSCVVRWVVVVVVMWVVRVV